MTTTPLASAATAVPATAVPATVSLTTRQRAAASRLLLWSPVAVWVGFAFLAIEGNSVSYAASSDEFGFGPIVLGFLCTVFGVVSLGVALGFSFAGARTRSVGVLTNATFTGVVGVLFAAFGVVAVATGGRGSTQFVLAGVLSLVPLAIALAVRPRDERP